MAIIDIFLNSGKNFQIDESQEIHRGGEGAIYPVPNRPDLVAKIYHQGINPITQEQFDYLSKLDKNLFVTPQELLYDNRKNIIGFTMEYLGQSYFPLSTIFSKNFCSRNGITPAVKKKICESLIKSIETAHKDQVVVGDFNQYNIMITKKGDFRLIDVDSYETPSHPHTGILLDDVRDYLQGGKVSKESDYFALSVMLFNSLTFAHPFKGIHKKFRKISDRMINRIPVFKQDPELRTPKCYEPINDPKMMDQFERMYIGGERFMMSMSGSGVTVAKPKKPVVATKLTEKDLTINSVIQGANVYNVYFTGDMGFIETSDNFQVFDAKNKGYLTKSVTIPKSSADKLYVGNKNVVLQKDGVLFHYKSDTDKVEIKNFTMPEEAVIQQMEGIIVVLHGDSMTYLHIDNIMSGNIMMDKQSVFGRGFRFYGGIVQSTGGVNRIFYNTGKNIAIVKFNMNIKGLYQVGNMGMVQYVEKNKIFTKLFKIDGLKVEMSGDFFHGMSDFTFKPTAGGEGFVFKPSDGRIKVIRSQDFATIQELECSVITAQSSLQNCNAGIIAWEGDSVYLMNKK